VLRDLYSSFERVPSGNLRNKWIEHRKDQENQERSAAKYNSETERPVIKTCQKDMIGTDGTTGDDTTKTKDQTGVQDKATDGRGQQCQRQPSRRANRRRPSTQQIQLCEETYDTQTVSTVTCHSHPKRSILKF